MVRRKRTSKRTRLEEGTSSSSRTPSPPAEPPAPAPPIVPQQPEPFLNEMGFVFDNNTQLDRYNRLIRRNYKCTRCVDWEFFEEMGLKNSFRVYLADLQLVQLSDLKEDTYRNLILEFLSSLEVVKSTRDELPWGTLKFRLKSVERHLTPGEFGLLFQVPHIGSPEVDIEFPVDAFWSSLIGREDRFIKERNASQMVDPQDRMLHAFLACTLIFRGSSTHKVTKKDLFLLWCLNRNHPVNAAGWIMYRMHKIALKDKGDIIIGGYVTRIARHFQIVLDDDDAYHWIPFVMQQHGIGSKILEGARVVKKKRQPDRYGRVQYRLIRPGEPLSDEEQAQEERMDEDIRPRRPRAGSSKPATSIESTMADMMAIS